MKIKFSLNLLNVIIPIGVALLMSVRGIPLLEVLLLPILVDVADVNLDTLLSSLKKKEFTNVKNWVVQNMDNDPTMVMRKVYDSLYGVLKPASIPEAVLVIAKYMNSIPIVPDQEINLLACLTEVMMSCEFK